MLPQLVLQDHAEILAERGFEDESSSRMTSRMVISGGRRSKASSHSDPFLVHSGRRLMTECTAWITGATSAFSLSANSIIVTIRRLT